MSRASRQRDSVAPTLFPFLAVLLCTMGALVLILMLIVAGAQAAAQQSAKQVEQQVEEVESQLQLASYSFGKQLAEGRIELEKKKLALQHLENHIQELLEELSGLKRTAELAQQEFATDEATHEEQAEAISQLERQLLEASQELKQKLDKPEGHKPIFAIIPYEGRNGTHRRPIYLECMSNGIKIQPEGILVRLDDLQPPYGPGNPLDAALRTIRSQYVPANQAVTSTAYPLLIVRPSGIRSYAMARAAMSGWDDQFGYELIPEDLELTFPESQPGLKNKIVQALELARQRQTALVMAMPRKYREFSGFDDSLGAESASGQAGDLAGGWRDQGGKFTGDGGESESGDQGYGQPGNASQRYGERGYRDQTYSEQGYGEQGHNEQGHNEQGHNEQGHNEQGHREQGHREQGHGGSSESDAGQLLRTASGSGGGPGSAGGDMQAATTGGQDHYSGSTASNAGASGSGDKGGSHTQLSQTAAGGTAAGGSQAMNMSGSQLALPFSQPFSSSPSAGQNAGSQTSAGQGASASSAASGQDAESGANPLNLNASLSPSPSRESATPVARRRGRGWAWSQGPPTQTPVVRSIRMQCQKDRWIVLPDSGSSGGEAVTIVFEGTPQARAEKLADVIADRIDSWGLALTGGYWKPTLAVDVAPDAAWRFDQLQQLLDGSGLEIYRLQTTAK